jgi:hypothetical protein
MSHHKSQHPKNNPTPTKKHSEGGEPSTNRHVFVEPGVQIDLVPDLKKTYQSSQSDSTTHNKKQLLWTQISAGLILIYAALTFWQGCLTRDISQTAIKQLSVSQRPLVGLDDSLDAFSAGAIDFRPNGADRTDLLYQVEC